MVEPGVYGGPEWTAMGTAPVEQPQPVAPALPAAPDLNSFLLMANIAEVLKEEVLSEMGRKVVEDYNIDESSRSGWLRMYQEAQDLAMQVLETREWAGEAIANVKYPALAISAIQFAARAHGNIVKGQDVVKAKEIGFRPPDGMMTARKERIGKFMSWQLLHDSDGWEDSLDQLLVTLPIAGACFKKTYFDPTDGKVKSPLLMPEELVVNFHASSIESAPRVTHVIELTPNEVRERVLGKVFLDVDLGEPIPTEEHDTDDDDAPHVFLEQHRWWDLDEDGYKEPYVVTVHLATEKVVRVTARYDIEGVVTDEKGKVLRIEPVHYFTRFIFMPAFNGNFYGMGFGQLLSPLNATINTTINQLLDAGTLSNRQGGFLGRGIRVSKGSEMVRFKPGEWKYVTHTGDDLKKGIVPLPVKEPSPVLFQLLDLMLAATKELASVSDVMMGEQKGARESPTTIMALIEQSMKVFTSIYKRIHRSLREEFIKVRRLNRLYLDPVRYQTVLNDPTADINDFVESDFDLVPVSDETDLTNVQKMTKAKALLDMFGTGLNDLEIQKRYLEAIDVPEIEKLMPQGPPPEDPKMALEKEKLGLDSRKLDLQERQVAMNEGLNQEKMRKFRADSMKSMVSAETEAATGGEAVQLGDVMKVLEQHEQALEKLVGMVVNKQGKGGITPGIPGGMPAKPTGAA